MFPRERVSARFDNKRGLVAGYGVPALASRILSLEGGSKHLEIQGETVSGRLKPGLHTLCPSFACEISPLGTLRVIEGHLQRAIGQALRPRQHNADQPERRFPNRLSTLIHKSAHVFFLSRHGQPRGFRGG